MPSVGVFAAVYDEKGHILLVRSATGRKAWSLPGGGMERGESPDEALRREVEEEAGYAVRTGRLIGVYSTPFKDNLVMTFEAHAVRTTKWAPNSEISEFGWFAPNALPEPIRPRALIRIEDALAHRHGVVRVFKRDEGLSLPPAPPLRAEGS